MNTWAWADEQLPLAGEAAGWGEAGKSRKGEQRGGGLKACKGLCGPSQDIWLKYKSWRKFWETF